MSVLCSDPYLSLPNSTIKSKDLDKMPAAGSSANQAIELDDAEHLDDQTREADENQRINEVGIVAIRHVGKA